jgi:NAD(P)H dehydrogenase (quinone)
MSRNIIVILGHPDSTSFCGALAETYINTAEQAGHSVKFFKLGEPDLDIVKAAIE